MKTQMTKSKAVRLSLFSVQSGLQRVAQIGLHLLMVAGVCVSLAGCHKEGPLEKAGRNVDEAATDVGNKIEDKCEQAKDAAGAKDTRC